MKTSETIIAHPNSDDKFEALKAFMKALKIKFEVAKIEDTPQWQINEVEKRLKKINNGQMSVRSLKDAKKDIFKKR